MGVLLPSPSYCALVDGLREYGALQGLELHRMRLAESDIQYLADAIKATDGGLRRLKSLALDPGNRKFFVKRVSNIHHENEHITCWDPIMVALASGAPCAPTLTALELCNGKVTDPVFRTFVRGLAANAFPALRRLELDGLAIDSPQPKIIVELPRALLTLAANGTPSSLQHLTLSGKKGLKYCIKMLGRVFEAGGLPCLTDLSLSDNTYEGSDASFDGWMAQGKQINIKQLHLAGCTTSLLFSLIEDPAFCPRLRHLWGSFVNKKDVSTAFEKRRRAIAAKAVAERR